MACGAPSSSRAAERGGLERRRHGPAHPGELSRREAPKERLPYVRAMQLIEPGAPLRMTELPDLQPGPGELRLRVTACGVCRTDLHVVDGELPPLRSPLVPGHEIVGVIDAVGEGVSALRVGERAGVGWLGGACGACRYCLDQSENLCDFPVFTGYTR